MCNLRTLTVVLQAAIITWLNALLFPSWSLFIMVPFIPHWNKELANINHLFWSFLWIGCLVEGQGETVAWLDLDVVKWAIIGICSKSMIQPCVVPNFFRFSVANTNSFFFQNQLHSKTPTVKSTPHRANMVPFYRVLK